MWAFKAGTQGKRERAGTDADAGPENEKQQ